MPRFGEYFQHLLLSFFGILESFFKVDSKAAASSDWDGTSKHLKTTQW